jgi:hypothetical protein
MTKHTCRGCGKRFHGIDMNMNPKVMMCADCCKYRNDKFGLVWPPEAYGPLKTEGEDGHTD